MKLAVLLVAVAALLGAAPAPARVAPAAGASVAGAQPVVIVIRYRVDGVTRIAKLGSDLVLGPGTLVAEVDVLTGTFTGDLWLPPAPGYFVVFGFVPSTARTDLIPVGEVTGTIEAGRITTNARLHIGLADLTVDGEPLDVGPDCRTAAPASVDLQGPFDLARIPLEGGYEIPAFTGCQGREPLDPLTTGLVSGPGNTIELTLTAEAP